MNLVKRADLVKFLIGAIVGALALSFWTSSRCYPLPCRSHRQFVLDEIIANPFPAKNRYEVNRWIYFTERYIFEPSSIDHVEWNSQDRKMDLVGLYKQDIEQVLQHAVELLNAEENSKLQLVKLINGYRRFDPQRGIDYILDVNLVDKEKGIEYSRRLTVVKPLKIPQLVPINESLEPATIHIITPLIHSNFTQFVKFMEIFERYCLKTKQDVTLLLVLDARVDNSAITNLVAIYKTHYPRSSMQVLTMPPNSSNTDSPYWQALEYATKRLDIYSLMVFYDINVNFKEDFLTRCRHNTYPHKYVYFPMVYSFRHPEFIISNHPHKLHNHAHLRAVGNSAEGRWLHNFYSIVCLYRHDYKLILRGSVLQSVGLNRDGSKFFELVLNSGISVFRSADPSLIISQH
ncbi:Chondroitin sulfate synthase 3 [Trichoplax sp. H2]|nr:Chondroitin sulfate synthase 3 [Trichoplax sp. H2]|eukprot:RDD36731.1 Chondroitin sulfate synthase 3 [Trichoplax sp. H2]